MNLTGHALETVVIDERFRDAHHLAACDYATKRAEQRKHAYERRKEPDNVPAGDLWLAHYEGFMEGVSPERK